jgi:hypothetical protein
MKVGNVILVFILLSVLVTSCRHYPHLSNKNMKEKESTAHIDMQNGVPKLLVNGQTELPMMFFFNSEITHWETLGEQVKAAAGAGVHIYSVPVHWKWDVDTGTWRYSNAIEIFNKFIAHDPKALFMPRLRSLPGQEWSGWDDFPEGDYIHYADGSRGIVSVASEQWMESYRKNLGQFIRYLENGPYGKRMIGYHLTGQNTGEWFHDQYRLKGPDLSQANQRAFRKWLKDKYQTGTALAQAWGRPGLTFEKASIPVPAKGRFPIHTRLDDSPVQVFYDLPEQRDWVDYSEYASWIVSQRLKNFSKVIKKETGGEKLAVLFYGYTFELVGSICGHYALQDILRCPEVDALAAPVSYTGRFSGQPASFMAPVDSLPLHDKMWFNEDDLRTHLIDKDKYLPDWFSEDAFGPQAENLSQTKGLLKRNFAGTMVHRTGSWWMDLIAGGAFSDPAVWEVVEDLRPYHESLAEKPQPYQPEVSLIVDEHSSLFLHDDWHVFTKCLAILRNECASTGASIGFYELQDFLENRTPPSKVYIFANVFHAGEKDIRRIHQRLKKEKALAIWQYAPGYLGESGPDVQRSSRLTGIELVQTDGVLGSRGENELEGLDWGWSREGAVSPRLVVKDGNTEVLGRYRADGLVSAARQIEPSGAVSIFSGDFGLSYQVLQKLFKREGVHLWTKGGQIVHTDGHFLAIHSGNKETVEVNIPSGKTLIPFIREGIKIGQRTAWVDIQPTQTRCFLIKDSE